MTKFQTAKQIATEKGIDVTGMKSLKEVEAAIAAFEAAKVTTPAPTATVEAPKAKPGRPIVEGSVRQIRLAKLAEKAANGELKRGRPSNPDSERQKRIQERETKKANGEEIKRGRPKKAQVSTNVTIDVPAPVVTATVEASVEA